MNRILLLLAVLAGFLYWHKSTERRSQAQASKLFATANPCTGKAKCAIVYVAPWCPSCKSLKPKILDVLRKGAQADPTFGMRVLVGLGRASGDDASEAATWDSFASVDEGGAMRAAYDINSYPTILVVDEQKRVVARGQQAVNQMLARSHPNLRVPDPPPGWPEGAIGFPE